MHPTLAPLLRPQGFLRNHSRGAVPPATGAEDAQADCVARLAPIVAAFAGGCGGIRLCVSVL